MRTLMPLVLLLMALCTLPQIARADAEADRLFQKVEAATLAAKTLRAEFVTTLKSGTQREESAGTLTLMRPRYARFQFVQTHQDQNSPAPTTRRLTYASDGDNLWAVWLPENQYQEFRVPTGGDATYEEFCPLGQAFFEITGTLKALKTVYSRWKISRRETEGGETFQVLDGENALEKAHIKLYIGSDFLIHRLAGSSGGTAPTLIDSRLKRVSLDETMTVAQFAFAPPSGAKKQARVRATAPLPRSGETAPDFTARDTQGRTVKLSDYRGRVVVLDFWGIWCGPCQALMPQTSKSAKKYAAQKVAVLAINIGDTPEAVRAWAAQRPQYAPLHFVYNFQSGNAADVSAFYLSSGTGLPLQYVIDARGHIVQVLRGYPEAINDLDPSLRRALSGASLPKP